MQMNENNIRVKPSLLYVKTFNGYKCKICGQESPYQSNMIRHVHLHESDHSPDDFSIFTYNGNQILKSTEKLLLWKCAHGIAMSAFNDPLFTSLFQEETIFSDKTNQKIINSMADQIIESNYGLAVNKKISLVLDGGTILKSKWIAFGYLHHTNIGLKFQVLDVELFDQKCTSDNIRTTISNISQKIKSVSNCDIVGACTDNASNFTKVFLEEEDVNDITPLGIIRVSCACHTVQLALGDLFDEDDYFRELTDIMKSIPHKLMYMKKKDIEQLGLTGFPPIQKQRWNSIYLTLRYIIKNLDGICQILSPDDNALMVMDSLIELRDDLEPVYDFTTLCESDNANQADVYVYYRALKVKLQTRMTQRADHLLGLIKNRFHSTLDITISKLCYFTTNAGIIEKRQRFPHVSADDALKNEDLRMKYDKEVEFFSKFSDVINHLCSKLNKDLNTVFNSFETLLKYYEPKDDNIHNFPKARDLRRILNQHSGELQSYIIISHFIEIIQTFPASESAAERIFARMRDILNEK